MKAVLLALLVLTLVSAECEDIWGNYTNQLGSSVVFDFQEGTVVGCYQTAVTNGLHYCDPDQKCSILLGTYQNVKDGCLLSFIVQWEMCDINNNTVSSTTSWIGKFYNGDKQIL